ncbi:hypothetical protein PR048_014943 [Dryococelus australis]|uniref:Uncharacterized protein n=1 Tax=Dryococelus australis TaxID=614101 RepID=A0ABQ9HFR4_9NEOP|nr:hypothetical protein PR048_014943 [Dryococelus australis]
MLTDDTESENTLNDIETSTDEYNPVTSSSSSESDVYKVTQKTTSNKKRRNERKFRTQSGGIREKRRTQSGGNKNITKKSERAKDCNHTPKHENFSDNQDFGNISPGGVQWKRKGDSSKWKKNVRKMKSVCGEPYIGTSEVERPGRPLLPVPCEGALMRSSLAKYKDGIPEPDRRGKHTPHNTFSEEDENRIRQHILGYSCKDQCRKCLAYNSLTEEDKPKKRIERDRHKGKAEMAHQECNKDKLTAKDNQHILDHCGQIFYLRKLAVYNLTVYNMANQDGVCYLWNEPEGKRGPVEIATCIYDYVMSKQNIKEVLMMSDGCDGQQNNVIFVSMCMTLCQTHPGLKTIDHKFFEIRHTEMECDSIHSKIVKKSKNVPAYVPEGWTQVIRTSRNNPRPFVVRTMLNDDFLDLKTNSKRIPKIPMRSICWLHYEKAKPQSLLYKTDFNETFQEMQIKRTAGRPSTTQGVTKAYKTSSIAAPKYKDLCTMCDKLIILREYHAYYQALKNDEGVHDELPAPDNDESGKEITRFTTKYSAFPLSK